MKIVLPHFSGDTWLLKRNLEWMMDLDGHLDYAAVLACDNETDYNETLAMAEELFCSVEMCIYNRAPHDHWPWQQNNAFTKTAQFMARQSDPWFWMETDCTPLRPGWLSVLEDEYKKGGKPFGGHWNEQQKDFNGMGIFNGVAIYPAHVARYSQKAVMSTLEKNQPPWDVYCSAQVYPQLHVMNHVMQHLWRLPDQKESECPTFPDAAMVTRWIRPEVVLFHRCKDGSLMSRLREMRGLPESTYLHGTDVVIPELPPRSPIKSCVALNRAKVDIFVVSNQRDLPWFTYCLKSINKYAVGYSKIVVVVPSQDERAFLPLTKLNLRLVLKTFNEQPNKGMIHHEAIVCMADAYSDADYILHVDSDCVFWQPVSVREYFQDGKPVLLKTEFAKLKGPVLNWQTAVELALGFKPAYETMQRHPAVHPRWLYPAVRAAVEAHTKKPFLTYVLSCRSEFPQTFAEFCTLGAWALENCPDVYHWIDVTGQTKPPNKLIQFWSHGGMDRPTDADTWGFVPAQFWGKTPLQIITHLGL